MYGIDARHEPVCYHRCARFLRGRVCLAVVLFFFSSRRRHTRFDCDWSSDVCSSDLATRYETPGGVTETSTERRVIFSPEIPGRRISEARPEWDVFMDVARRVRPDLAGRLGFESTAAIRADIARAIPFYDGIQRLQNAGDQFQYGGPHLCWGWKFPTPDRSEEHTSELQSQSNIVCRLL